MPVHAHLVQGNVPGPNDWGRNAIGHYDKVHCPDPPAARTPTAGCPPGHPLLDQLEPLGQGGATTGAGLPQHSLQGIHPGLHRKGWMSTPGVGSRGRQCYLTDVSIQKAEKLSNRRVLTEGRKVRTKQRSDDAAGGGRKLA